MSKERRAHFMFRFSTRDLILVTAITALAIGWAVDHWRLRKKHDRVEQAAYALLMFSDPEGYVTLQDGSRWP